MAAEITPRRFVFSRVWNMVREIRIWIGLCLICLLWIFLSQLLSFGFLSQANLLGKRQDDVQFDGALTFLENKTIEWRYAARGSIPSPLKVIYVNVDADSISALGNFPWNRELFAQAIH
ncbi:MAG TPA: CHASE2 domain-containing protein, partial [Terrimicrobiaceae bacterium]|nr:CHASE2 domain-containing protein [Terrimicrobiaceae bacterium]